MTKVQSWEVEVRINGESALTIGGGGAAHIAGDPEIDSEVVRNAAEHLLAFIGQPQSPNNQAVADAMSLLSDLFSETAHETWTKGEVVEVIEDFIKVRCPGLQP
jgi:hypothetical protein